MLVVDASCLVEVVTQGAGATAVARRLTADTDHVAPHVVDVEVLGVIRRDYLAGVLDQVSASLAVTELMTWPGTRIGHQPLLRRAWELRDTVRGWDAMYVALAEELDAILLTRDGRLARATGPRCIIDLVDD